MSKNKASEPTPLMQQYYGIKAKHPDALLLFRVGDFYETFGEDAIKTAKILGIVLTYRNNGSSKLELAGFPHHSVETYLPKLVRAGYRVAVCDQLEDPKMTKTIVKRGVTELITPGVAMNDQVLEQKLNNFLASVYQHHNQVGISFLDISTGEFLVSEGSWEYTEKLLQSFKPTEILYPKQNHKTWLEKLKTQASMFGIEDWVYSADYGKELLLKHFDVKSLKSFGIEEWELASVSAGAILQYLADTEHQKLKHISSIARIQESEFVWLDRFTIRNLELFDSPHADAVTLIDILDQTKSPMGSRLLRRWLSLPLKDLRKIEERHSVVDFFCKHEETREFLENHIRDMGDLERLISKVAVNKINPREILQLHRGLHAIEPIKTKTSTVENLFLNKISAQLNPCQDIRDLIEKTIDPNAPVQVNKGGVIKSGISNDLDDLRNMAFSGKDYLLQLQQREIENTGISSLKVGFNNVFGYYLEVTHTHKDKVPPGWHRKQTLTSAERYVTDELKEYESKILGAEEKILVLETQLYQTLVGQVLDYIKPIQLNAHLIATLDVLSCFARIATQNQYCKPNMNDGFAIDIEDGRHPVIEKKLPIGEPYISNSVYLDDQTQQIIMITGPNMAGKSALLRQTALIAIMAQMGSFVPAKSAKIGLIDQVFTRVGASDNISSGESTFMVEMTETASILNNISARSLILLDEIGRGTSTYDGVSIAWAISEFLHEHPHKPKTLFATHYHELNNMSQTFSRIKNFNVSVKEMGQKILFLRKLMEGGSAHSFGIHVAKMAGIPIQVTHRANEGLKTLEAQRDQPQKTREIAPTPSEEKLQLSFFQLDDPVLGQIKDQITSLDVDRLTPVEALMTLNEIKKLVSA